MELAMCMDVVNNMSRMWTTATPEDKQGMARNLFEYLVYDLDTRRITDFRLKPWADRFLILRASLYDLEAGEVGEEKQSPHATHGVHTDMPHRGLRGANRSTPRGWRGFGHLCTAPNIQQPLAA